jgi:hypothetical protein
MENITVKSGPAQFILLISFACLLLTGGCARYASNVNTLYEPAAGVRGGSGEVYIVIPESLQTRSTHIKWVLGKVTDDDNRVIDDVFSPRSPAELIQAALGVELKRAGNTVIPATKLPVAGQIVIDLTKTEIELEQLSDLADLKAKCRVVMGIDLFKNGQMIKRLLYESASSKTDIKDRDLLAEKVLNEALQSVMLQAIPDLHNLINL